MGAEQWLSGEELGQLTQTWEIWALASSTPARLVARSRLYLFFLLARFAGLRVSEIHEFSVDALDLQTGYLQLKDRSLFLPPAAMRPMRRILSLPQASKPDFLRMDAGFIRRTFYDVAKSAKLRPEACAPRALRNARALELLAMHMPAHLVAELLGFSSSLQLSQIAGTGQSLPAPNRLAAAPESLVTDGRAGRLRLKSAAGILLSALVPLEELARIEPAVGKPLTVFIPPEQIYPSRHPLPMANRIECEVQGFKMDTLAIALKLKAKDLSLHALVDASVCDASWLACSSTLYVYIPAQAVKLEK